MDVKLGKWEKDGRQRIYFNASALGNSKIYAYAGKNGRFEIGRQVWSSGQSGFLYDAENTGVELIEKLLGKQVTYDTKFAEVWEVVK